MHCANEYIQKHIVFHGRGLSIRQTFRKNSIAFGIDSIFLQTRPGCLAGSENFRCRGEPVHIIDSGSTVRSIGNLTLFATAIYTDLFVRTFRKTYQVLEAYSPGLRSSLNNLINVFGNSDT